MASKDCAAEVPEKVLAIVDKIKAEIGNVCSTSVKPFGSHSGYVAQLFVVKLSHEDGSETDGVLKAVFNDAGVVISKQYDLAREGMFYKWRMETSSGDVFDSITPTTYYAEGDFESGTKVVLMENLTLQNGVESGMFFGKASLHNWARDIDAATPGVSAETITRLAFVKAAKFHAKYWNDMSLVSQDWLIDAKEVIGENRDKWQKKMDHFAEGWAKARDPETMDPHMVACIDASIANISWDAHQAELKKGWTLIHGDYHPGNMLYLPGNENRTGDLRIVDWEAVTLGSGPRDIGQYMLSHASPEFRRSCEKGLVEAYWEALRAASPGSVAPMTLSECWASYKRNGIARWITLLIMMQPIVPADALTFFYGQVTPFLRDHFPQPSDTPQPL
mmetsp:Transcript_3475/g.5966  ORF Transcript_3475/g.5966 Transcript_3475/m.5966 type:complete len:390 (+) Transcript_3475:174-1343(+)